MLRREGEARREQQLNNKAGNGEAAMAFPDAQSRGGCEETPGLPTAPAALTCGAVGVWGVGPVVLLPPPARGPWDPNGSSRMSITRGTGWVQR